MAPPTAVLRPLTPLQALGPLFRCIAPGPAAVTRYPILASKLPLSEDEQEVGETVVTELSSKQAREKCNQTLVAGLRLIRPEERVTAIAAALEEVEAQEKRLYAEVFR
jgi:hypothetical protein